MKCHRHLGHSGEHDEHRDHHHRHAPHRRCDMAEALLSLRGIDPYSPNARFPGGLGQFEMVRRENRECHIFLTKVPLPSSQYLHDRSYEGSSRDCWSTFWNIKDPDESDENVCDLSED